MEQQWKKAVQTVIDLVENDLSEPLRLEELARRAGYSPSYLSALFRQMLGISLKSYTARRRLCAATLELRDTGTRLADVAVKHGFSSQQAFTRAFVQSYGCSPAAWRRRPLPIALYTVKAVLFPHDIPYKGEYKMQKATLTAPTVRVEHIPAHSFIAIRDPEVDAYFPFFERHDCDTVTGLVESLAHVAHPQLGVHTAGWYYLPNGKRGYAYGICVDADYEGPIPEGFERYEFPSSYYLSFGHPPFDFMQHCEQVLEQVETLAWRYDPAKNGFAWNEEACQPYQLMAPDVTGYHVLRPVKKLG